MFLTHKAVIEMLQDNAGFTRRTVRLLDGVTRRHGLRVAGFPRQQAP